MKDTLKIFFSVSCFLFGLQSASAQSLVSFADYFAKNKSFGTVASKESANFKVSWVNPRDEVIADALLAHLEAARTQLQPSFKEAMNRFPVVKAPVEIFPDLRSFSAVSKLSLARFRATGTIALTLEQRLMILSPRNLTSGYSWAETVVHEYIHYLIREISSEHVPIWLHEGVAQFYQGYPYEKKASLRPMQWGLFKRRRAANQLLSLKTLQEPFPYRETPEEADLAYIQSLLFVEWLNTQCGIVQLIVWAEQMDSLDKSISKCTQLDMKTLEAQFISKVMAGVRVPAGSDVEYFARDFTEGDPLELEGRKADQAARNFAQLSSELFNQGRFRASTIEMQKALKESPVSPPSWRRQLALGFGRAGKEKRSEKILLDLVRDYPTDAAAWYLIGSQWLKEKNYDGAWQAFLRSFFTNPFLDGLQEQMSSTQELKPELKNFWQLKTIP